MLGEVPEGEISLHQCSQCDRSFKQERALRIHRNVVHTNPRWKHMKHTNPSSTQLTLTKRKKRRKTKAAMDSGGQETSEEITSKPRNTRIITQHGLRKQFCTIFDIFGAGDTSFGILCRRYWKTSKHITVCAAVRLTSLTQLFLYVVFGEGTFFHMVMR